MAIHPDRPQTAETTQNNPLKTNGPKTQTPPRRHAQGRDRTSQRADPSTQGTHPCLGESVYLDEDTYNHALEVHGTVQCLEPQIKTYDEKNILKKEKDQLLETLHTKMIGSIAADSNAEMNRVNAELYPDGSRKVCP